MEGRIGQAKIEIELLICDLRWEIFKLETGNWKLETGNWRLEI
jgi:hypothetical protein